MSNPSNDLRTQLTAWVESADRYAGLPVDRDRVIHDLRAVLAATDPVPPAEVPQVERCPECRHVPHDKIGFCPNMASDNDCSCTYVAPPSETEYSEADREARIIQGVRFGPTPC